MGSSDLATCRAAALDDLLARWHRWQADYRPVRGFKGRALVCGDYNAGRHWADDGAHDDEIEREIMRGVDRVFEGLPDLFRVAITWEARNIAVGASVFVSPRLPADPVERREAINAARDRMTRDLLRAGLM